MNHITFITENLNYLIFIKNKIEIIYEHHLFPDV
jgi:hypothetical protein